MAELGIGVVWLLLALMRAVEFRAPNVSAFELRRRAAAGESRAARQLEAANELPGVKAVQRLVVIILAVAAIGVTVLSRPGFAGLGLAFVLLVCVEMLASWRFFRRLASRLGRYCQPWLAVAAARLGFLLRPFQGDAPSAPALPRFHSRAELQAALQHDRTLDEPDRQRLLSVLSFADMRVKEVMTPFDRMTVVDATDALGALLLDRLHKSGRAVFAVLGAGGRSVEGTLFLADALRLMKHVPAVREAMRPEVCYIRDDAPLNEALQIFLQTQHPLFIVVSATDTLVGGLDIGQVLEALTGRTIEEVSGDFHDRRAVAAHLPRVTE